VLVFSVLVVGLFLGGRGWFVVFSKKGNRRMRGVLVYHINFQKIATDNAWSAKARSVPFQFTLFGASGSGKSQHFRYTVATTLRTLPMNMASEGFRLAVRGLRNRASSITIGKRPKRGMEIAES
jgi:hypothetical protein